MQKDRGNENIHSGHRARMLESYLSAGIDSLSDVEALELLLGYAISRRDVNPLAHRLLNEFGSLHRVFEAPVEKLQLVSGIGPRTAALIRLASELWGRCERSRLTDQVFLRNTGEIGRYLVAQNDGAGEERAWLLSLDARCRVIECRELCRGAVNSVNLPFRRVVEAALLAKATSVVLAHNHTSGTLLPSLEDVTYTRQIAQALELVDVTLIDHFVLGDRNYISMKASGMFIR